MIPLKRFGDSMGLEGMEGSRSFHCAAGRHALASPIMHASSVRQLLTLQTKDGQEGEHLVPILIYMNT